MDWTWKGGLSLLIKLSLKGLVEIVTVTVILIVTVGLVVAVTMAVVVRRVVVVGTASSAANLDTLLESAQMVTAGEVTDMVAEMIGMVVVDLTVVATVLTVAAIVLTVTVLTVAATVLTVTVIDLSVAVTDILAVAEIVGAGVTATVVTDQVPTDSQDLEKCVSSRYENPIYYHEVCFLVFETL
jgi:hypothetical protein